MDHGTIRPSRLATVHTLDSHRRQQVEGRSNVCPVKLASVPPLAVGPRRWGWALAPVLGLALAFGGLIVRGDGTEPRAQTFVPVIVPYQAQVVSQPAPIERVPYQPTIPPCSTRPCPSWTFPR